MIRNIVFDMGNVLILYSPMDTIRQKTTDEADGQLLLRELFGSVEWLQGDRGTITEEGLIAACCARLPQRLHGLCGELVREWHNDIPCFAEMEALIARLKAAGYGIYLLSNTSKKFHEFRKGIGALQYFDGCFISADHGLMKPDLAIYRAFYEEFGLNPAECFFVDDAPANIEAAAETGMRGFVFRRDVQELEQALLAEGIKV